MLLSSSAWGLLHLSRISKPAQLSQCCSAALSAQAAVCLENSGISTERACTQSAAFEKCCINWAQLHSGLPLPGSCQGAMRHTQPALCCQEVPQFLHSHKPGVLQSQHGMMALGWPCNMVPTSHTAVLRNPRQSMKVLLKLPASHERAYW